MLNFPYNDGHSIEITDEEIFREVRVPVACEHRYPAVAFLPPFSRPRETTA